MADGWEQTVLRMVTAIDASIRRHDDDALLLRSLAASMGYSEYYASRKFREISGMTVRDYVRFRRLAFALMELRNTRRGLLEIALDYGYSSHEAFTRAFKDAYGITPSDARATGAPVALRTVLKPLDCYLIGMGGTDMKTTEDQVKTYFVHLPAHRFLHIRNYESIGYWDFWQKQSQIPGQDCETICKLLANIPDKLDDEGGSEANSGNGQLMAYINEPAGRLCSWGIPLAEAYGVRLPADYSGSVPEQMQLMDVAAGDYIVFEHGPFDYETENALVEQRIEEAMKRFNYDASGYRLDMTPGQRRVQAARKALLLQRFGQRHGLRDGHPNLVAMQAVRQHARFRVIEAHHARVRLLLIVMAFPHETAHDGPDLRFRANEAAGGAAFAA